MGRWEARRPGSWDDGGLRRYSVSSIGQRGVCGMHTFRSTRPILGWGSTPFLELPQTRSELVFLLVGVLDWTSIVGLPGSSPESGSAVVRSEFGPTGDHSSSSGAHIRVGLGWRPTPPNKASNMSEDGSAQRAQQLLHQSAWTTKCGTVADALPLCATSRTDACMSACPCACMIPCMLASMFACMSACMYACIQAFMHACMQSCSRCHVRTSPSAHGGCTRRGRR